MAGKKAERQEKTAKKIEKRGLGGGNTENRASKPDLGVGNDNLFEYSQKNRETSN